MRRKARFGEGAEYYSLVRSLQAIDRSDVTLLVVDATDGVTHQDHPTLMPDRLRDNLINWIADDSALRRPDHLRYTWQILLEEIEHRR